MLWIFKLFIQDSETVAQSQSEEVDLCKINALLEDEVEVQENEEDDDEADEEELWKKMKMYRSLLLQLKRSPRSKR